MATDFEVMARMAALNRDIRMCPDVLRLQKVKAGTQITVGVAGDVVGAVANDTLIAAFYLIDREQFRETRREMEAEERKDG